MGEGATLCHTYALGRLITASENGKQLASYAYDGTGRRTQEVDASGTRVRTTYLVRGDFDWDQSRKLAKIHLGLADLSIATQVDSD